MATLGNTTVGANPSSVGSPGYNFAYEITVPAGHDILIDSISIYCGNIATNIKPVIWNSSNAVITNGVGNAFASTEAYAWKTGTFTNKPKLTAGTTYRIGGVVEGSGLAIYYSATTTYGWAGTNAGSYSSPGNFVGGFNTVLFNIYLTYTVSVLGNDTAGGSSVNSFYPRSNCIPYNHTIYRKYYSRKFIHIC